MKLGQTELCSEPDPVGSGEVFFRVEFALKSKKLALRKNLKETVNIKSDIKFIC